MKYYIFAIWIALIAGCEPASHRPASETSQDNREMAPGVPRAKGGKHENEATYLTPTCASFSPNGKQVLVGYDGYGSAREPDDWTCLDLWDTGTGERLQTFTGHK